MKYHLMMKFPLIAELEKYVPLDLAFLIDSFWRNANEEECSNILTMVLENSGWAINTIRLKTMKGLFFDAVSTRNLEEVKSVCLFDHAFIDLDDAKKAYRLLQTPSRHWPPGPNEIQIIEWLQKRFEFDCRCSMAQLRISWNQHFIIKELRKGHFSYTADGIIVQKSTDPIPKNLICRLCFMKQKFIKQRTYNEMEWHLRRHRAYGHEFGPRELARHWMITNKHLDLFAHSPELLSWKTEYHPLFGPRFPSVCLWIHTDQEQRRLFFARFPELTSCPIPQVELFDHLKKMIRKINKTRMFHW